MIKVRSTLKDNISKNPVNFERHLLMPFLMPHSINSHYLIIRSLFRFNDGENFSKLIKIVNLAQQRILQKYTCVINLFL